MIDTENMVTEILVEKWYESSTILQLEKLAEYCDRKTNKTLAVIASCNGLKDLIPTLKELGIAHMKARYIPWPVWPYCRLEPLSQPSVGQSVFLGSTGAGKSAPPKKSSTGTYMDWTGKD